MVRPRSARRRPAASTSRVRQVRPRSIAARSAGGASDLVIVVDAVAPSRRFPPTRLADDLPGLLLDQRAFGPRKLLVAFADEEGHFSGLAVTDRIEQLPAALEACILHMGRGAIAAVALCDEEVVEGDVRADVAVRYGGYQEVCSRYDIELLDWFACDDQMFRSFHAATESPADPD